MIIFDAVLVGKREAIKQVTSSPVHSEWRDIPDSEAARNGNSLDCLSSEGSDDDDDISYHRIKVSINMWTDVVGSNAKGFCKGFEIIEEVICDFGFIY